MIGLLAPMVCGALSCRAETPATNAVTKVTVPEALFTLRVSAVSFKCADAGQRPAAEALVALRKAGKGKVEDIRGLTLQTTGTMGHLQETRKVLLLQGFVYAGRGGTVTNYLPQRVGTALDARVLDVQPDAAFCELDYRTSLAGPNPDLGFPAAQIIPDKLAKVATIRLKNNVRLPFGVPVLIGGGNPALADDEFLYVFAQLDKQMSKQGVKK